MLTFYLRYLFIFHTRGNLSQHLRDLAIKDHIEGGIIDDIARRFVIKTIYAREFIDGDVWISKTPGKSWAERNSVWAMILSAVITGTVSYILAKSDVQAELRDMHQAIEAQDKKMDILKGSLENHSVDSTRHPKLQ